jgi:hypothetical protein
MSFAPTAILAFLTVAVCMTGMAEVPPDERAIIDRIIGAKGGYTAMRVVNR